MNDIKSLAHSFEATAVYELGRKSLTGNGEPEQLSVPQSLPTFFAFFGVHPVEGREFLPSDEQKKNGDVVLLSYGLWQRRFAGDPKIVGSASRWSKNPTTVAGVLPGWVRLSRKPDAWVPLTIEAKFQTERMHWTYFMPGQTARQRSAQNCQSEMDGIAAETARQYPKEAAGIKFSLVTLQQALVSNGKTELLALLGAVGFLLLIACANVSNLVLSPRIAAAAGDCRTARPWARAAAGSCANCRLKAFSWRLLEAWQESL